MEDFSSTVGVVALVGCVLAALALLCCAVLLLRLRRLRAAQRAILGPDGERDLVTLGADLAGRLPRAARLRPRRRRAPGRRA